jgi:hypothetical protein
MPSVFKTETLANGKMFAKKLLSLYQTSATSNYPKPSDGVAALIQFRLLALTEVNLSLTTVSQLQLEIACHKDIASVQAS